MTLPRIRPVLTPGQAKLLAGLLAAVRDGDEHAWLAGLKAQELRKLIAVGERVEALLEERALASGEPRQGS